ncbi:MAG TPA: RNA polymerase factor sigma-32 [Alphaproteobacteria bacterium]|nr:RNA polymerase factor sigma-32 [Alphaproteobacteria bacterium]
MAHAIVSTAAHANRRYVRQAMAAPLLEKNHEFELAARWRQKGDVRALHELITAYLRLVVSIGARYRNYGLPMGDLVQEGNVGLMQAAQRFEPEREIRFSTYASWWIRSAIQDFILRNWSIVRTGTTAAHKTLFFNLRRLRAKIDGNDGRLTNESRIEIANQLHVRVQDVEAMETRLGELDQSLNTPISADGDGEWLDMLSDERPLPEEAVQDAEDSARYHIWLDQAMASLSDREAIIIRARRLNEESATLAVLGDQFGISKERVRQIEHQAMKKLRTAVARIVSNPADSDRKPV